MAFVVPNFNLLCNIGASLAPGWPPSQLGVGLRLVNQACALVYGHRNNVASTGGTGSVGVPLMCMSLLLPAGTDVRGLQDSGGMPDVVECPAGTGRWYGVAWVDDIGKGYPNEHRTAMIQALQGVWVAPYG